jgi:Subtilase family
MGKDSATASGLKDYVYFLQVKKEHALDSVGRNKNLPALITPFLRKLEVFDSALRQSTGKERNYYADIVAVQPADSLQADTKKSVMGFFNSRKYIWEGISMDSVIRQGREAKKEAEGDQVLYAQVNTADPLGQRREIVGDDPSTLKDSHYGNPIVGDEHADHGSHCACIIAGNADGDRVKGVADNVIILPVRAINALRYGDEMDKDVSLAIWSMLIRPCNWRTKFLQNSPIS